MAKNLGHRTAEVWLEGTQEYGQNRSNGNMFFEGDTIYSYGKHFPLATKLEDGYILLNGDTYSVTTNQHQAEVRAAVRGMNHIIIPFSTLRGAGIDYRQIQVIEVEPDRSISVKCRSKRCLTPGDHTHEQHLMGRSVFKATVHTRQLVEDPVFQNGVRWDSNIQESYYLSGVDETFRDIRQGHFLAELPYAADNVAGALEALKPEPVKDAEDEGIEVKRQGEWFFIPRPGPLRNASPMPFYLDGEAQEYPTTLLQHREGRRMPRHSVTELKTKDGKRFARGTVRHSEGDHRMLKLGNIWHEVWENTELSSFRGGGRID